MSHQELERIPVHDQLLEIERQFRMKYMDYVNRNLHSKLMNFISELPVETSLNVRKKLNEALEELSK